MLNFKVDSDECLFMVGDRVNGTIVSITIDKLDDCPLLTLRLRRLNAQAPSDEPLVTVDRYSSQRENETD